jgi:phage-related baseplate assembly protein
MPLSERVQAARKRAQQLRLDAKSDKKKIKTYPAFIASTPQHKVLAAANEGIRLAREDLKLAAENLAIAEIDGEGLDAAQEAFKVARLVVHNREVAKRTRRGVSLTNAGGA